MSAGRLTRSLVTVLDRAARALGAADTPAAHLTTGRRGEEAAYFHLRKLGYTMIARNWRSPRRAGEIDLIGWDGEVLCFVEVKTRTRSPKEDNAEARFRATAASAPVATRFALGNIPAEAAVDADKQDELAGVAREFLRRQPAHTASRGDVVSVYLSSSGAVEEITLFKNAFAVR